MALPRVLVVDDNTSLAETIADVLTDHGYEVALATSGTEALVAWRAQPADLVVVDVDLPDVGGLSVARRLARRAGRWSLVVMSARRPERVVPLCEEIGAVFLAKPFGPSHLLAAVRSMLEQRRRRARESAARGQRPLLGVRKPRGLLQNAAGTRRDD